MGVSRAAQGREKNFAHGQTLRARHREKKTNLPGPASVGGKSLNMSNRSKNGRAAIGNTANISAWLVKEGLKGAVPTTLLQGFCERLVAAGIPLQRAHAGHRALHPVFGAVGFDWHRDGGHAIREDIRQANATVNVTFDHKHFGHVISSIKRDEVIEFDPSRFTSLRDGLVSLYGPYKRIKYPNKMEPAGLIVGFEWKQRGIAYLSVSIHRDPADDSSPTHQTTFLTRSLPGMKSYSIAAAYYRETVQNFRDKCTR
jgi:hypothetical protein